jgi:hypothetical protein
LPAGIDFVLKLEPSDDGTRELLVEKQKDGEDNCHRLTFRLEQRELGRTEKGKAITSMIVKYLEGIRSKAKTSTLKGATSGAEPPERTADQ